MCPSSSGDRASASGAESRRFESYLGHHSDFPRTRMMRVFFFFGKKEQLSPSYRRTRPPPCRTQKVSPQAGSPGRGIHAFREIYCRQLRSADVGCCLRGLGLFDDPAAILTDKRPDPPKTTASSSTPISRNGLQQAAWQCSQPHRRRTTRQAPRYQCLRD